MSILMYIRYLLRGENRKRDAEPVDETYEDVFIERKLDDGTTERVKVDKVRSFLCGLWKSFF